MRGIFINEIQIRLAKSNLRDALEVICDIKTDFVGAEVREAIFLIKDHIIGALELLKE